MKTPLLYLDQNTLIDVILRRDPAFASVVTKFCSSAAQAVYAPPHIEEIANIYRSTATDVDCDAHIAEHLRGIRELTESWELLPNDKPGGPGRLIQEDPQVCLERVINHYELTYLAEANEEALREHVLAKQAVPTPVDAFQNQKLKAIWQQRMCLRGFDPQHYPIGKGLRASFKATEQMIDICFRSLHDAGFGLETKRKTRSAIHDVSHAIYATMADIFVSRDERMLSKIKAVFSFLKVECVAYSPDEFLAYIDGLLSNAV